MALYGSLRLFVALEGLHTILWVFNSSCNLVHGFVVARGPAAQHCVVVASDIEPETIKGTLESFNHTQESEVTRSH